MFKMGCSMARKILAIDGKGSSSSSSSTAAASAAVIAGAGASLDNGSSSSNNNNNKKPKETAQAAAGGTKQEDLNDFSKLEEDPRLPLNVRQIFKITKSWKAIARTMSKTGTAMFLNLFEQNQDLFYLFERFQHLKGKELHESMELREHAATVMSTLDQSINSLSDYDNFVTYLHSIGKLHHKVPGFKREHFWKIEQPFLKAVKQTLDERCNETIEEIYRIAIKLIIETISEGYGEDRPDVEGGSEASGDNSRGQNGSSGLGDKSTGSRDKEATGHSQSGAGSGGSSSTIRETTAGRQTTASSANQLQQQQQRRATIRGRSGENRDQPSSPLLAEAEALDAPSTVRIEGGKQVVESSCACPVQRKLQEEQGRLRTGYTSDIESDSQLETEAAAAAVTKSEQLLDREQLEDRLKTTIICLKELLSLAVEGAAVEQRSQSERDIVVDVGCESRQTNRSHSKNENELREETESEMQWSGANRSVKAQSRRQSQNEWAALIGCGAVSANDKLKAASQPANNEDQRQKQQQHRCGGIGLFGRLLPGLDRWIVTINRKRTAALLRKGSPSEGLGYISSKAPAEPCQAAAAAAAPREPRARQFTTSGRQENASRGRRLYLIERGRLDWWQRLNDVVKRRQQQRSLGRLSHTRDISEANKDNSSESFIEADLGGLDSWPPSLANESYRATSESGSSCRRPEIAPLSQPLSTSASDVGAADARGNCNYCSSNNDISRRRAEQRERDTTGPGSPRSIRDTATETGAWREEATGVGRGCRFTACLPSPVLDGDATGDACSRPLNNRFSTRPCNETNSPHHHRQEFAAGRQQQQQQPKSTHKDELTQAARPARMAASAKMHPRDRDNDRKYNLEEMPKEQNIDDDGGKTIRRGKIPNGCPVAPTKCPVKAAAAPLKQDGRSDRCGGGTGDDCNCNSGLRSGGVRLSPRKFEIGQSSSGPGKITGNSTTTKRRIEMLVSRVLKFSATKSSGSVKLDHKQQQQQNRPKVNENEDLVLRVNEAGGSSERNQQQQSMGALIGKADRGSQFAVSGRRHNHQEQQQSGQHHRTRRPSCLGCPLQTNVEVEATAAATATGLSSEHNKHPQSKNRVPTAAAAKSPVSRLTGNAGDLGELIKMLMLTLLTTPIGKSHRQPDELDRHNHAQQQQEPQEPPRPIPLTMRP